MRQRHPRGLAALSAAAALASGCAGARGAAGAWGPEATILDVRRPAAPQQLALFLGRERLGTWVAATGVEVREGQRVLVARSTTTMAADAGSGPVRRREEAETVYEARPGGRLLAFSLRRSDARGGGLSVVGRCAADGCVVQREAAGRREERRIPLPDATAEDADAARLAAARRATVATRWLDPETLAVTAMRRRFVGEETVEAGAAALRVAVVEETSGPGGQPTLLRFAADGRLVSGTVGPVAMRAEAAGAPAPDRPADLRAVVRLALPAAPPRSVPGRLVLRLRGVPGTFQLDDQRQAWSPQADGTALVTVTARFPAAIHPEADTPRGGPVAPGEAALLAATADLDADEPSVKAAAREITAAAPGAYQASLAILRHLTARVAPATGLTSDRASDLLRLQRADPRERAHLFTALARAAGIPARLVDGLAYLPAASGPPALFWRRWVEVRSGGEWIAIDPALDQPVADATHLTLTRTAAADPMVLLGAVEVLEVRAEP